MPTINQRLLLRLIALAVLLAGGVYGLHAIQSDRIVEALHWQAENAANNGRLDKAIQYLSQYLEFRPNDHEAAVQLADMILKRSRSTKDLAAAMFILEKVSRESPQREDVRRKLVDVCLRLGRYSDAMIHLEAVLLTHPQEAELLEQQATCQMGLARYEEARKSLETAVASDPKRISAYELMAQLLLVQMNLPSEAESCIAAMVKANPQEPSAYLIRARFLRSLNRIDECLVDVNQLLVLDAKSADGLLIYAEISQARGELPRARTALTTAIAEHPNDFRLYRALSWLELNTNNLGAAITVLEQGLRELPNETELLSPLADLLAQQGELDKAEALIKKLESRRVAAYQIAYLKARLAMQRGKYREALTVFEPLRTQAVGSPTFAIQLNLLIALCEQKLGNREAQQEALARVLRLDAGNQTARMQLGNVMLAQGQLAEAIQEYTLAVRSKQATLSARMMLGRLRIAHARATHAGNEEWNSIASYAQALSEQFKQSAEPVLLLGELMMARKQYDAARKMLRDECGKKLNDPRLWVLRAKLAHEMFGLYAALEILDEAQSLLGETVDLRLARAKFWAIDWQPGRTERIHALDHDVEGMTEPEQIRLLANLGEISTNRNDWPGSRRFFTQLAGRMPKDLPVRLMLFHGAARQRDTELLARLRKEIAALEPEGSELLAVAEALTAEAIPPSASDLATRVLRQFPDRADAHLLAARVAEKAGDFKAARSHHDLAIEFDTANLRYLTAKLEFLLRTHQDTEGSEMVSRLLNDPRVPTDSFRSMIETAVGTDSDHAEQLLKWLRPLLVEDADGCRWAAQFAAERGKTKDAAEWFDLARNLAPVQLDGWVQTCRWNGTSAENLRTLLEKGRTTLEGSAYLLLIVEADARIRALLPDWQPKLEAPTTKRSLAQAWLTHFAARNQSKEALVYLKDFVKQSADQPEDSAWANRNIAMLQAMTGTPEQRREAIASLKKAVTEPTSVEEMRSRVTGLTVASRQMYGLERRATMTEAIRILKKIVASKDSSARDWYHLGQFYRLGGDKAQYRDCLKELIVRDPDNLYFVVAYVEDLLETRSFEEAERFRDRLQKASHDLRAVSVLARLDCMNNRADKAILLIEQFQQAAEPGTDENINRTRQVADLLDQLARLAAEQRLKGYRVLVDAALEKYRFAIKNYPEAVAKMAGLLAFDNQVSAAFEQLNRLKANLSPKILTSAGVTVLSNGTATPRQFQIVLGWIEDGLKDQPNSPALLMNLAGVHTLRQEYPAAAKAYEALLKVEPNNIVALNNLAWILAPQAGSTAIKYIDRAIELVGPTAELLDTRARILIADGSYERAIEDLRQANEQSQSGLRYFHMAIAQWKLLRKEEAMKTFQEAKSHGLDPRSIHPNDMGTYQAMLGQSNR